jgi:hypothetical protein
MPRRPGGGWTLPVRYDSICSRTVAGRSVKRARMGEKTKSLSVAQNSRLFAKTLAQYCSRIFSEVALKLPPASTVFEICSR